MQRVKRGTDETAWVLGKFSKTRLKRMFTMKLNVCRMIAYQVSREQSRNGLILNDSMLVQRYCLKFAFVL